MNNDITKMSDENKLLFINLVLEFLNGYIDSPENNSNEEKSFCISLSLELIDATIDSLKKNDIPLMVTYLDYLQELCNYIAITFDAPTYIKGGSEILFALQSLVNTPIEDYSEL